MIEFFSHPTQNFYLLNRLGTRLSLINLVPELDIDLEAEAEELLVEANPPESVINEYL